MIKYKVCAYQPLPRPEETTKAEEWLRELFAYIDKHGLDDRVRETPIGGKNVVFRYEFDEDRPVFLFFRRTGICTGHFVQRIIEPSGTHFHSDSLEFEFEPG